MAGVKPYVVQQLVITAHNQTRLLRLESVGVIHGDPDEFCRENQAFASVTLCKSTPTLGDALERTCPQDATYLLILPFGLGEINSHQES